MAMQCHRAEGSRILKRGDVCASQQMGCIAGALSEAEMMNEDDADGGGDDDATEILTETRPDQLWSVGGS